MTTPDPTVTPLTRPASGAPAVDHAVGRWFATRRYRAEQFAAEELRAIRGEQTVTVIVPVRECATTIAGVLELAIEPAVRAGLVDEVLVVDADSADGSATVAAAAGARVVQQDQIRPELGATLGKGDAMWRALQVSAGEIVCFMDGDTRDPAPAHLLGLLGPLLADPSIALVKGAFARPFDDGHARREHEGGRVTELMARPLINLHAPLLAGFAQPLAGEFAARRDLLEEIAFPVGYGVEIASLLDALTLYGLDALAECDLGSRQNRHQPLRALGEMAYSVLAAFERRLDEGARSPAQGGYRRPWAGGTTVTVPIDERPPIREREPSVAGRQAAAGG